MDYNKTFMNMLPYVVGLIAVYIGLNTFFGVDLSEMVSKNVVENMENDVKPVEEPSSSLPENKV